MQPSLAASAGHMTECRFLGTWCSPPVRLSRFNLVWAKLDSNPVTETQLEHRIPRATKTIKSFLLCQSLFSREIRPSPAWRSHRSHSPARSGAAWRYQSRRSASRDGFCSSSTLQTQADSTALRRIESQLAAEGNKWPFKEIDTLLPFHLRAIKSAAAEGPSPRALWS